MNLLASSGSSVADDDRDRHDPESESDPISSRRTDADVAGRIRSRRPPPPPPPAGSRRLSVGQELTTMSPAGGDSGAGVQTRIADAAPAAPARGPAPQMAACAASAAASAAAAAAATTRDWACGAVAEERRRLPRRDRDGVAEEQPASTSRSSSAWSERMSSLSVVAREAMAAVRSQLRGEEKLSAR
jgi:hypothetical protein